ncbi:MAG: hypothetical protein JNL58_05945 [Planctomyces sp.]|nr:hypothetical protein [Planctomyces sp.]
MDSEPGRFLILWTVRVSVGLYAIAVLMKMQLTTSPTSARLYRLAWLLSWCFCVIHVVCAYHFQHHWDQAAALKHTAEMTRRVVGIYWSGGLYVNYVFLTLWGVQSMVQLVRDRPSGRVEDLSMHALAAFMMFNATAVFGPAWWIAVVAAYGLVIVVQVFRGRVQRKKPS